MAMDLSGRLLGINAETRPPFTIGRDGDLSEHDLTVLFRVYTGQYGGGYAVVYSEPGRREPTQRHLVSLASLDLVEFYDAASSGWDRGMWAARLTCVGANAVFRGERASEHHDTYPGLDGHPGCSGYWLPEGACTTCRAKRPLDHQAYLDYLDAIDEEARAAQIKGPQLWCVEHGWMRQADVTTTKVCRLAGTHFHDGALQRTMGPF